MMTHSLASRFRPCAFALILSSCCSLADAGERVALVIGNSRYPNAPLKNPSNDVDLMSEVLSQLDFEVLVGKDVTLQQMQWGLRQFRKRLTPGGVGLFFFCGHGLQVKGENFLVPIDAGQVAEHEVPYKMLNVGMALDALENSRANLSVVVLDCCRDNPLQRSWSRNARRGLAAITDVPQGTLLAYSTSPGLTAADGRGNNSPYTTALARVLSQRPAEGLELVRAFRQASRAVRQHVDQRPWINFDASMEEFYLWKSQNLALGGTSSAGPPASSGTPATGSPPQFQFALANASPDRSLSVIIDDQSSTTILPRNTVVVSMDAATVPRQIYARRGLDETVAIAIEEPPAYRILGSPRHRHSYIFDYVASPNRPVIGNWTLVRTEPRLIVGESSAPAPGVGDVALP